MYLPPHFEEARPDELRRIIAGHSLGTIVVNGPQGLDANQLPFELDEAAGTRGFLRAHVARANPLWREVRDGDEALVVFRAADAYVSPNWYPSKREHHRHVPTWNYQVVNVHGSIRIRDDEKYVRGVVARLTRAHEAAANPGNAWRMGDAPKDYIDAMLQAIVGIEVEIARIVAKSKLSQNRDERDRAAAADELEGRGHEAMANAMRDAHRTSRR